MTAKRIGEDTLVRQHREPVSADVEGAIVMMSLKQGKYYGLDAIGTRIWELIAEVRSIGEVCDTLMEEFEVDRETCRSDVLAFVGELAEENLVEIVDAASA